MAGRPHVPSRRGHGLQLTADDDAAGCLSARSRPRWSQLARTQQWRREDGCLPRSAHRTERQFGACSGAATQPFDVWKLPALVEQGLLWPEEADPRPPAAPGRCFEPVRLLTATARTARVRSGPGRWSASRRRRSRRRSRGSPPVRTRPADLKHARPRDRASRPHPQRGRSAQAPSPDTTKGCVFPCLRSRPHPSNTRARVA